LDIQISGGKANEANNHYRPVMPAHLSRDPVATVRGVRHLLPARELQPEMRAGDAGVPLF